MKKYEVFHRRNKRVCIERMGSWMEITEETKKPQGGYWETSVVRVPYDSLYHMLQEMNHEVKP